MAEQGPSLPMSPDPGRDATAMRLLMILQSPTRPGTEIHVLDRPISLGITYALFVAAEGAFVAGVFGADFDAVPAGFVAALAGVEAFFLASLSIMLIFCMPSTSNC